MLSILLFSVFLCVLVAYVCFIRIFASPKRKRSKEDSIPSGKVYQGIRPRLEVWMKNARTRPHKRMSIRSFDGIELYGRYYEYQKHAPIEILFHGYRGNAIRDMSGGIDRCFRMGHNALVIEQRGSCESTCKVISFGINESRDCESWVDFTVREIDPEAKIVLTGVSMGAATVMLCTARPLPRNVVAVLADCGYTSAREIIQKVMSDMRLPPRLLYPFVRLGARLFGHFDPDEDSPMEALKRSRLPVIFIHGDEDDFVPYSMSVKNYEACASQKRLVTIKGAGHGVAYPTDIQAYEAELADFLAPYLS